MSCPHTVKDTYIKWTLPTQLKYHTFNTQVAAKTMVTFYNPQSHL